MIIFISDFLEIAKVPDGGVKKNICNTSNEFQMCLFFISKNVKAIVIACNTASAKAANKLREKYSNQIIIAIEPAYKMVYDFAYDKTTLVMATKDTIESEKFNALYEKYNKDIQVKIGLNENNSKEELKIEELFKEKNVNYTSID